MFKMLAQLWAMFTVFFAAGEKLANATNHLATWAEESAGTFADEARINRTQRVIALEAQGITPTVPTAKAKLKAT